MLGLKLRSEFLGAKPKATAIELTDEKESGATQIPAREFLEITYPTRDVLHAIEATGPDKARPVVIIGERGQGKSHILGVLHHTISSPGETRVWLTAWAGSLKPPVPDLANLPLRQPLLAISESLHRHRYKHLWDILFDRHPQGDFWRKEWQAAGTPVPSDVIVAKMLAQTPVALILDEFQTWYDGLTDKASSPYKKWAFNFVQILSEVARTHPDRLVLVVSVRNGNSDAFQQLQRLDLSIIDFKGPSAKRDRQRLLLHRLFENRLNVPTAHIQGAIDAHVSEYLRLRSEPPDRHEAVRREFAEAWPFSPDLLSLLEDQVLVATNAQETRDLIRILADVYRRRGEEDPVVTPASFRVDDEASGINALLSSIANEQHAQLRKKALRNIEAVQQAVPNHAQEVPHLVPLISALWLRSIAVGNLAGAEPGALHADITGAKPVDDNIFQSELAILVENSFNIHPDSARMVFREEENPQAKLLASARNDKLFESGADRERLALETRYVIGGAEDTAKHYRVIVLPLSWRTDPWSPLDEKERPSQWDERLVILVVPEPLENVSKELGPWLKAHLSSKRNVPRFLLPRAASGSIYSDRTLVVPARAVALADEWKAGNPEYKRLQAKYEKELRDLLRRRSDRFAVLHTWNFQQPEKCEFEVLQHNVEGADIPKEMRKSIVNNLFDPPSFKKFVKDAAEEAKSVGKLLEELQEPRPNGEPCIPWLGETELKERIIHLCAAGEIAIDVRGMDHLQRGPGETENAALLRMRGKLGSGRHLDETYLRPPQAGPQAGGIATPGPAPTGPAPSSEQATLPGAPPQPPPGGTPGAPAGSIFGPTTKRKALTAEPNSSLNLLGTLDSWGIFPETPIENVALKVGKLTGAQLKAILKGLPVEVKVELALEKEDQ